MTINEMKKNLDEEAEGAYQPKVSTWGMFERPKDISKAYGGGRTVKKGEYERFLEEVNKKRLEQLRNPESRKRRTGEDDIDAEVAKQAQRNISIGFSMLESFLLYEAKEQFQATRMRFPFRSLLAGRATYGLALTLDAMGNQKKAQDLYKSLIRHPNSEIKKSAETMLSGFEAMEFFNMTSEDTTDYSKFDKYFTSMGQVSRYDLSQMSMYKRTQEDIENEEKDQLLSLAILFGLFAIPLILIESLRLKAHLPLLPFSIN